MFICRPALDMQSPSSLSTPERCLTSEPKASTVPLPVCSHNSSDPEKTTTSRSFPAALIGQKVAEIPQYEQWKLRLTSAFFALFVLGWGDGGIVSCLFPPTLLVPLTSVFFPISHRDTPTM